MTKRPLAAAVPFAIAALFACGPAAAEPFAGADVAAGSALHAKDCAACHARQFGGADGSDIYTRADRKVTTPEALTRQISLCTSRLELLLFPDDERDLAGYLNKHYYRFK